MPHIPNSPHEYELSNRKLKKRSFTSPILVNLVFKNPEDVQSTSDITPSDITPVYGYNARSGATPG